MLFSITCSIINAKTKLEYSYVLQKEKHGNPIKLVNTKIIDNAAG